MPKDFSPNVEWRDIDTITPYALNTKTHPTAQIDKIASSIAEFGMDQPIVVDADGVIVKGHGRHLACKKLGIKTVPVVVRTDLTPAQIKASRIMDNKSAESEWDIDALKLEMTALQDEGFSLELTGFDDAEITGFLADHDLVDVEADQNLPAVGAGSLAQRFGVPPFSVLNAREGWWQERKRAWLALGIQSELGRGAPIGGAPLPLDRKGGGKRDARRGNDASC